jgi:hypothetical protein
MGTIIKRPIANAAWQDIQGPGRARSQYREPARQMREAGPIEGEPDDPILTSLGFVLAHDQVDTAIVGTSDPDHMQENLRLADQLPIPQNVVETLRERFDPDMWG